MVVISSYSKASRALSYISFIFVSPDAPFGSFKAAWPSVTANWCIQPTVPKLVVPLFRSSMIDIMGCLFRCTRAEQHHQNRPKDRLVQRYKSRTPLDMHMQNITT